MPLWGKTDANADKPLNWVASMTGGQLIYVDETEASLEVNKERGLNAPGWWEYKSYTDTAGNTRHKAIHLIALVDTTTTETQTDDAFAADAVSVITISGQPSDQSTDDGVGTATFTVVAADAPDLGDIVYQWQVQTATGTRWTNVSGGTSASLALSGLTTSDSGKKYRVKLTSTAGAAEVISNTATLTVTAA